MSNDARFHLNTPAASLEYELRRVLATTLNDLISMEAADLVEDTVALADSVMSLLTGWHIEPPTEGGTEEDTTDQGSSGGETAAEDDRAGADSREVGAVVSEVPPATEEGGVGEPSTDAPLGRGTVRALFESVAHYAKTDDERELMDLAFRTAFQMHPDYWHEFDVLLVPTAPDNCAACGGPCRTPYCSSCGDEHAPGDCTPGNADEAAAGGAR
jgi:hypothetical protein